MHVTAIRTRRIHPPKDDLLDALATSIASIRERTILAVSSKVVSIWQGRCISADSSMTTSVQRALLAKQEADRFHEPNNMYPHSRLFTLYEGVLMSNAGVDQSNADGYFILLPQDADGVAEQIRSFVCQQYGRTDIGVIIVDSRTQPLRNGAVGVALGYAGFAPLIDYRGSVDVFGRSFQSERLSVVDTLASTATFIMGEGSECTPCALFEDLPQVAFTTERPTDPLLIPSVVPEKDVFAEFFCFETWDTGGRQM